MTSTLEGRIIGFVSLVMLCLLSALFFENYYTQKSPSFVEGVIQEKSFTPSNYDVAIGVSSNGGVAAVPTGNSEKYILFVSDTPIEVKKEDWLLYNKGDKVKIEYYAGKAVRVTKTDG